MRKVSQKKIFDALADENYMVVYFSDDGCCPCKVMEPIVENFEKMYNDEILFLNYQIENLRKFREDKLVNKYDAVPFPTAIFFYKGEEVQRIVGECPERTFDKACKNLLGMEG